MSSFKELKEELKYNISYHKETKQFYMGIDHLEGLTTPVKGYINLGITNHENLKDALIHIYKHCKNEINHLYPSEVDEAILSIQDMYFPEDRI